MGNNEPVGLLEVDDYSAGLASGTVELVVLFVVSRIFGELHHQHHRGAGDSLWLGDHHHGGVVVCDGIGMY